MISGIISGLTIVFAVIWFCTKETPFYWAAWLFSWLDSAAWAALVTIPQVWAIWLAELRRRQEVEA